MAQKLTFIINPIAGPRDNLKYWKALKKLLKKRNIPFRAKFTKRKEHATRLAFKRMKKEADAVLVSIGGDGTFNEVATALVKTEASLAHIPRGSGNGLARMLNIPVSLRKVPGYLVNGTVKSIDAGKIGEEYFFCTAGFGFDALIAHHFENSDSRGLKSYILYVFKVFFGYNGLDADFELDDERFSGRFFTVTIANANQYGNNAFIAPEAKVDDGLLDVTIIRPFPKLLTPLMAIALFGKSLHKLPYVETRKVRKMIINEVESSHFHRDGDAEKRTWPAEIEVVPSVLKILVPPK